MCSLRNPTDMMIMHFCKLLAFAPLACIRHMGKELKFNSSTHAWFHNL